LRADSTQPSRFRPGIDPASNRHRTGFKLLVESRPIVRGAHSSLSGPQRGFEIRLACGHRCYRSFCLLSRGHFSWDRTLLGSQVALSKSCSQSPHVPSSKARIVQGAPSRPARRRSAGPPSVRQCAETINCGFLVRNSQNLLKKLFGVGGLELQTFGRTRFAHKDLEEPARVTSVKQLRVGFGRDPRRKCDSDKNLNLSHVVVRDQEAGGSNPLAPTIFPRSV
jgi:hypothetical protein